MKISVIVPVYKVEKYIGKCIQSLLDQTYTNFEALIVDDGSPDQSIAIAKKMVREDPRFIFLEKKNGGQASARNMGLDYAIGEYIAFLDPDDYFRNDMMELCIQSLLNDLSIDIVLFGICGVLPSQRVVYKPLPNLKQYIIDRDMLLTNGSIDYSVCNKIFRNTIFQKIRFIEGIIYEDKAILPLLLHNKNLFLLQEYLYFYVTRPSSTMNSYDRVSNDSFLYIYNNVYKNFLKKNADWDKYYQYYQRSYIKYCFYSELIKITKFSTSFYEDIIYMTSSIDKNIVNHTNIKKYYPRFSKYRIVYTLFSINPKLYRRCAKIFLFLLGVIRS